MNRGPGPASHPARILIVDDERLNRQLLEVMLAPEGFAIRTAASGEEALVLVAQQPPDLILLDIMMPGMDGFEVALKLKGNAATSHIPIVMVTSLDDRHSKLLGLNVGAEDFLSKPVDRAEVLVRVRNLLRLKAYGDYYDQYSQELQGEVDSRTADLVDSVRLYRSTFDSAPVGIVHVGLDGQWRRANQRLSDLLGYSLEELQGPGAAERLQSPEDIAADTKSFGRLAAGLVERHTVDERRYRRPDGSHMWARVNTSLHRDALGQPERFISVIEDITAWRTLEAQFRQASKMDAIGRLASGITHDFTNLVSVILCYAELLTDEVALASQPADYVNEIVKAAESATVLTTQLLAFSREQVLHAAPLDLNLLITRMTSMLGRVIGQQVEIVLALAPDLSLALADSGQVEQVVLNLVVNARDAMAGDGIITIESANVELTNDGFHDEAVVPGHYVMIAVNDTGSGMTGETKRRLFEPFFTTKEPGKGTGLGLATTYGIVNQSKGYIRVTSELGVGTSFKVYLPTAFMA